MLLEGSAIFSPNTSRCVPSKSFNFRFIRPDYLFLKLHTFLFISFANFNRSLTCLVFSKGTFLRDLEWKPVTYLAPLMVSLLTLIPAPSRSVLISERVMKGFIWIFLLIHLEVRLFIFLGLPFLRGFVHRCHTSYTFWIYSLLLLELD